jgi:hypothetical protein
MKPIKTKKARKSKKGKKLNHRKVKKKRMWKKTKMKMNMTRKKNRRHKLSKITKSTISSQTYLIPTATVIPLASNSMLRRRSGNLELIGLKPPLRNWMRMRKQKDGFHGLMPKWTLLLN